MPIVPSKKAVARRSGLREDHWTWNAQLLPERSYAEKVSVFAIET
jgi:hypothetical protein